MTTHDFEQAGMAWWNALSEAERDDALTVAGQNASVATVYRLHLARKEREELIAVLRAVEKWWLEQGMQGQIGAPSCIFDVRELLAKHAPAAKG